MSAFALNPTQPPKTTRVNELVNRVFRWRWLASVALLICLDISTYLALDDVKTKSLFANQDKALHILGFMGFYTLGHISLNFDFFPRIQRFSWRLTAVNWSVWLGYGLFIELMQGLLRHRSASMSDLLANAAGLTLGALIVVGFRVYPRRRPPS